MPSGSRVQKFPMVGSNQDGTLVGLPTFSGPEPTGLLRLEVGESPTGGDPTLLRQEAYAPVMSKASHDTSEAQDNTRVDVDLAVESSAPPVKASTVRHEASMTTASSATQTEMNCGPTKASMKVGGLFSDGFHARALPATRDRVDTTLFHTTRTDLVSFSPTELLGCLAGTLVEAESLFSGGLCADEPPSTLGKAETEGDRALIGLELSNYVLSPPRVRIEEGGVPGGDEGDRVEGASDIQGIDTSYQANQSVLALTKVKTAYVVEA